MVLFGFNNLLFLIKLVRFLLFDCFLILDNDFYDKEEVLELIVLGFRNIIFII